MKTAIREKNNHDKFIALINCDSFLNLNPMLSMGIFYIGSHLRKLGYNVKIFDEQVETVWDKLDFIAQNSILVGFSVITPQIYYAAKYSIRLKQLNKKLPIVWGGIHPTLFPEQTLGADYIDYVVMDEGEDTVSELMQSINTEREVKDVAGLAYKNNRQIFVNNPRQYIDINRISPPEWGLVDMNRYIHKRNYNKDYFGRQINIHTGRGCVYKCTFCINTSLKYKKIRLLNTDKIINEINSLKANYPFDFIEFTDDNFCMDKNRLKEFCEKLLSQDIKIKWSASTRIDYFNSRLLSGDMLKLMEESGCICLQMGAESGSQRVLDEIIKKDIKVEETIHSAIELKKYNIVPVFSFMGGMPGETADDFNKTVALIKKLKALNEKAFVVGPQLYRPYPGTEMYEVSKKMGLKEPHTIDAWAEYTYKSGFLSIDNLNWVINKRRIVNIFDYFQISQYNPPELLERFAIKPFRSIALMRIRFDFYDFAFEKDLFIFLTWVYIFLKRKTRILIHKINYFLYN